MDGEPAVGLTAAESEALLAAMLREVEDRRASDPSAFPLGYVIVSADNASQHKRFLRTRSSKLLNVIPANSPDIHKVVEHPLNPFNRAWYKEFTADRRITTCESAMALAAEILHRTKPESIYKDILSMPDTFRSIIKNRGDWADPDLC